MSYVGREIVPGGGVSGGICARGKCSGGMSDTVMYLGAPNPNEFYVTQLRTIIFLRFTPVKSTFLPRDAYA